MTFIAGSAGRNTRGGADGNKNEPHYAPSV